MSTAQTRKIKLSPWGRFMCAQATAPVSRSSYVEEVSARTAEAKRKAIRFSANKHCVAITDFIARNPGLSAKAIGLALKDGGFPMSGGYISMMVADLRAQGLIRGERGIGHVFMHYSQELVK